MKDELTIDRGAFKGIKALCMLLGASIVFVAMNHEVIPDVAAVVLQLICTGWILYIHPTAKGERE